MRNASYTRSKGYSRVIRAIRVIRVIRAIRVNIWFLIKPFERFSVLALKIFENSFKVLLGLFSDPTPTVAGIEIVGNFTDFMMFHALSATSV